MSGAILGDGHVQGSAATPPVLNICQNLQLSLTNLQVGSDANGGTGLGGIVYHTSEPLVILLHCVQLPLPHP